METLPAVRPAHLPATIDPTVIGGQFWGGIDVTTREGKVALAGVLQDDATSIKDVLNTTITIVNVVCHEASRAGPTPGELQTWTRTVLFLDGGGLVDCGSNGVHKSIGLACLIFGPPPWPNGLKCTPKAKALGDGQNYYQLKFEVPEEPRKSKK